MIDKRSVILPMTRQYKSWITLLFSICAITSCSKKKDGPGSIVQPEWANGILSIVSGNYQWGADGQELNEPIVVSITDQSGDPISGIDILFRIIIGGDSVSDSLVTTDADGLASVTWRLGDGPQYILKATLAENSEETNPVYVYANAQVEMSINWIADRDFYIYNEQLSHDNRILETNHFLIFSDASVDDVKIIYAHMAEESFYEIKEAFDFHSSMDLNVSVLDVETKMTIYTNRYITHNQLAFPYGFFLYGQDSQEWIWWGYEFHVFRREVKHEVMHVVQYLMGLSGRSGLRWPDVWFTEGIAEYISGGAHPTVASLEQLAQWRQHPDHYVNPIAIHEWHQFPVPDSRVGEYYRIFGLAVRYLLEPEGHGKTFLDVKEMFYDMLRTGSFSTSFENAMGISLQYYEDNFYTLITDFLNQVEGQSLSHDATIYITAE